MSAITYNGINYICINTNINKNDRITLEDEVYYTLKDIFLNCDTCDMCNQTSCYMDDIAGNINNSKIVYTRCLYDINFVKHFLKWLDSITINWFIGEEIQEPPDNPSLYVEFDEWWKDFQDTREKVRERLEKIKEWEKEYFANRQKELPVYDLSVD